MSEPVSLSAWTLALRRLFPGADHAVCRQTGESWDDAPILEFSLTLPFRMMPFHFANSYPQPRTFACRFLDGTLVPAEALRRLFNVVGQALSYEVFCMSQMDRLRFGARAIIDGNKDRVDLTDKLRVSQNVGPGETTVYVNFLSPDVEIGSWVLCLRTSEVLKIVKSTGTGCLVVEQRVGQLYGKGFAETGFHSWTIKPWVGEPTGFLQGDWLFVLGVRTDEPATETPT